MAFANEKLYTTQSFGVMVRIVAPIDAIARGRTVPTFWRLRS